jgi:hypothetical protein
MKFKPCMILAVTGVFSLLSAPILAQSTTISRTGVISQAGSNSAVLPALPNASLTEGFEGAVFPPAGWIVRNQSTTPGTNVNCWNQFTGATPWVANTGVNHAGANFNCTTGSSVISGWLISSQLTSIQNGDTVSFFTREATTNTFPDRLEVRVCIDGAPDSCGAAGSTGTTDTDVGQFTTLVTTVNPTLVAGVYPNVFTQFSTVIAGLPAGGDGRIAFRYFVTAGGPSGLNSNLISIDDVSVVAGVVAGVLTVAPASTDFGTVAVGATSADSTVTLGNSGAASLSITAVSAAAAPFASTGGTCGAVPITIAAGASCTLTYNFTPAAAAAATQTITLTTTATGAAGFDLTGTGTASPGVLGVSSTTVAFGPRTVGSTSTSTLTITNTGAGALNVNTISLPTAPFTVAASGTCAATPFVLAAGASCTVVYNFAPATAGPFTSPVTITSDGGNSVVNLTGTGVVAIPLNTLSNLGLGALLGLFGISSLLLLRRKA